MIDKGTRKRPWLSSSEMAKLVGGSVVFGVLMSIRTEVEQMWLRILIAACAGGVLGLVLLQRRNKRDDPSA